MTIKFICCVWITTLISIAVFFIKILLTRVTPRICTEKCLNIFSVHIMKKQTYTKVHLSDKSFDNLRAMRKSMSPSADFRKSVRRQFSVYMTSESSKLCQTILLILVLFQFIIIIGVCVISITSPGIICKYLINCNLNCRATGMKVNHCTKNILNSLC